MSRPKPRFHVHAKVSTDWLVYAEVKDTYWCSQDETYMYVLQYGPGGSSEAHVRESLIYHYTN